MPYTYFPSQVVGLQPVEGEIGWNSVPSANDESIGNRRYITISELSHLSNPAVGDQRTRTQALACIGFQVTQLPPVISGIEVNIKAQRGGRVVDEQIQLTYQGQAIGINNFKYQTDYYGNLEILNNTTYGGTTDLWGATLTPEMLQDPSFGVIVKFQAHPYTPHRTGIYLDSVSLTVY